MYERLVSRYGVGDGCAVLEIGPGSGQVTIPLLDLGCHVTAVELGARLADRLAARTEGRAVDVVVAPFEHVELPDASFDLVLSATAFHWVDPSVGIPKAFRLLRGGGWLVLVWNVFGDDTRSDPFHEALSDLLQRIEPDIATPKVPGSLGPDGPSWAAEIDGHGTFEPAEVEIIRWTGSHSTEEARALFGTFSSWISRGPERKAELLDQLCGLCDERFGGRIVRPYQTVIVAARKPDSGT